MGNSLQVDLRSPAVGLDWLLKKESSNKRKQGKNSFFPYPIYLSQFSISCRETGRIRFVQVVRSWYVYPCHFDVPARIRTSQIVAGFWGFCPFWRLCFLSKYSNLQSRPSRMNPDYHREEKPRANIHCWFARTYDRHFTCRNQPRAPLVAMDV